MTCTECSDPCAPKPVLWVFKAGSLFYHRLTIARSELLTSLDGYGVRGQLRRNHFELREGQIVDLVCAVEDAARRRVIVRLGADVTRLLFDGGVFDVEVYKLDDPSLVFRVYEGRWTTSLEATLEGA